MSAVTLIIVLLIANGLVFCIAYSAYVQFQYRQFRRVIPGLWETGDRTARWAAHMEMLTASDPRMDKTLKWLLFAQRLLLLSIALAVLAYVVGFAFHH